MSRFLSVILWSAAAMAAVALVPSAEAQPGGGGRGGFGGGPGGGPGGGLAGLLRSDEVRQELEVSDDQLADLQAMGEEIRDQMRSMFEDMRDLSPEERRARFETIREDMQDIQAQAEERMGEILLPHQLTRLREINLQQQVRRGGLGGALQGQLAEELGITAEQREKMAAKAQELQQDMQEKIEQMRKDAQEELMSLLTPEQQAKLKSMLGTDFEMQDQGFGRFGGPAGANGGRRQPGPPPAQN